ncbi:hypothetical protein HMPREF1982_00781 [Clostridiales bacterium oral taxon 876 str. F0540]|nr:hypothetical protein HMPREF1982_00781 [Clostridiales bacterium oral taxon 876 str. F0540]
MDLINMDPLCLELLKDALYVSGSAILDLLIIFFTNLLIPSKKDK